jgi:hypothetical protein
MTVESATFITSLNATLPPGTDPKSEGDDHLRLIKAVLLATFPNLNAAVTMTPAQLNTPYLPLAGGTLTGGLSINRDSAHIRLNTAAGALGPVIQYNGGISGITNAANNAWNLYITDTGSITLRAGLTVVGIANNSQLTQTGLLALVNGTGTHGGAEMNWTSSDGYHVWIRARTGGGLEVVNNAYNAVLLWFDDPGNFYANTVHSAGNVSVGSATYYTNGDINGGPSGAWGANAYLSTAMSNKSPTNTQIPWASALTQMSNGNAYSLGSPWFMAGLSGPGNGTLNAIGVQAAWPRTP